MCVSFTVIMVPIHSNISLKLNKNWHLTFDHALTESVDGFHNLHAVWSVMWVNSARCSSFLLLHSHRSILMGSGSLLRGKRSWAEMENITPAFFHAWPRSSPTLSLLQFLLCFIFTHLLSSFGEFWQNKLNTSESLYYELS